MSARRSTRPAGDARRNAHLAKIHIAKKWAAKHVAMTDDHYKSMVGTVMSEAGDRLPAGEDPSAKWLSELGRVTLLRRFRGLGWPDPFVDADDVEPAPGPRRQKGRTNGRYPVPGKRGMISQRAADYLAHLKDLADWTDDAKRLLGFIERQVGKPSMVASLTRAEATVIITGMEYVVGIKDPKTKNQRARWGKVAQEERDRTARQRQAQRAASGGGA